MTPCSEAAVMARAILRLLWRILVLLVPRFTSEDVAIVWHGDGSHHGFHILCSEDDVRPDDQFDGWCEIRSINWLGVGVAYAAGNFRTRKGYPE